MSCPSDTIWAVDGSAPREIWFRYRQDGKVVGGMFTLREALDDSDLLDLRLRETWAHADVDANPSDPLAWRIWAGHVCLLNGLAAAEPLYARAIHLGMDDPAVWHNLGCAYLWRGDLVPATLMLERSSAQNGHKNPLTLRRLAQAYAMASRHEEAIRLLEEVVRLAPDRPEFREELTEARRRPGLDEGAVAGPREAGRGEG